MEKAWVWPGLFAAYGSCGAPPWGWAPSPKYSGSP